MIYDTFDKVGRYFKKDSSLHKALSYARELDPSTPDGKYEIDGDAIYALVKTYETSSPDERRFEAHKKYIDVQVLLEGKEIIGVSLEKNLKLSQEYSESKDIMFLETPKEFASLVMKPGYFAVFYPHDIHRPNCHLHEKQRVRKIVVKVHI
jgi:YhcH/YjgK/YiaL family protein